MGQATAANGDFGEKGAVYATKVLGGTAYKLLSDPSVVKRANEVTGDRNYETPLPLDGKSPFDITAA